MLHISTRFVGIVPDQPFQPLLYSKSAPGMPGALPLVDQVCRRRWNDLRYDRNLHRSLAGDVAIPKHDVVRIDEARNHEERLAAPACLTRTFTQPPNALARDEEIVLKAAARGAADIPTCTA